MSCVNAPLKCYNEDHDLSFKPIGYDLNKLKYNHFLNITTYDCFKSCYLCHKKIISNVYCWNCETCDFFLCVQCVPPNFIGSEKIFVGWLQYDTISVYLTESTTKKSLRNEINKISMNDKLKKDLNKNLQITTKKDYFLFLQYKKISKTMLQNKHLCPMMHDLKIDLVEYKVKDQRVGLLICCDRCKQSISHRLYCWHCSECWYDVCFKCLPPDYDKIDDHYVSWFYPTGKGLTYFMFEDTNSLDLYTFGTLYINPNDLKVLHITTKKEYFYFLHHGRMKRESSVNADIKLKEHYIKKQRKD